MNQRVDAGRFLLEHLSELMDRHVEGAVGVMSPVAHDCPSEPVGKMHEFESSDGSISIQWCEACEWHSIQTRSGS